MSRPHNTYIFWANARNYEEKSESDPNTVIFPQVKHQTRVSYKCAAAGCEYSSLDAADMKRHMALEHVLVVKNADGTGTTQHNVHETYP